MKYLLFFPIFFLITCTSSDQPVQENAESKKLNKPYAIVLGIAQDAGFPQADCKKKCCKAVWKNAALRKLVSCIAVVDPITHEAWMIDATPDFREQLYRLQNHRGTDKINLMGIFLTHAHIGHYTGLMQLGREVMGAKQMPVYAMPRMEDYLRKNGPWSQLVKLKNIELNDLKEDSIIVLNEQLQIQPILVPHRDEYSETVGFKIMGPKKKLLFIPDINKWQSWEREITKEIHQVDYAFLDGTFFADGEIPGRNMSQIPHPFIQESMSLFESLERKEKEKIFFIHFNHTNPVLQDPVIQKIVEDAGFNIAKEMKQYSL